MKMTLLEMVRNILLSVEGDSVTLWNDTNESTAIGHALQEVYFQMVSNTMIPEHFELIQLTDADASAIVFMEVPETVARVEWLKYNKIRSGDTDNAFGEVRYLAPKAFMSILLQRKSSDVTTVSVTDPTSSIVLDMIGNDAPPTYWTSFDDHYICFDSYDAAVDPVGLVEAKSLCWASINPVWTFDDDFIPDMDDNLFPYLLAETKSLIFVNQKQQANPKVENQAKRQRYALQNDKFRTRASQKEGFAPTGPNYGRNARGR